MIIQNMPLIYAHGLRPDVSDKEAEQLFKQAAQAAYDEVIAHCRLLRGQEIHNRQMNLQRETERRETAEREQPILEQARAEALRRQAELKAAEDRNGPRRGSGW